MRFIFLGTSAGEQYPAFWCRCENCRKARDKGGKNIRKSSCAWISPDCLIDFPPEIFMQAARFNIPIIETNFFLITHSHEDHFFPYLLAWRKMSSNIKLPPDKSSLGPRFSALKTLQIFGNNTVCTKTKKYLNKDLNEYAIKINRAVPFQKFELGKMKIIPILANHPDGEEKGLNYIIQKDGKTIFYGLDTGWFLPESEIYLKKCKFDLVVLEGTFGYAGECGNEHFNFKKLLAAHQLFEKGKLLKKNACFLVSHLSPHFSPPHDEIAPIMRRKGIIVAYDGMEIKL